MEKNVGDLDAYLRITGGLSMLGIGIARKSSSLIFLGSMKVAEGITRFCPLLYLLNFSTVDNSIEIKFAKNFNENEGNHSH